MWRAQVDDQSLLYSYLIANNRIRTQVPHYWPKSNIANTPQKCKFLIFLVLQRSKVRSTHAQIWHSQNFDVYLLWTRWRIWFFFYYLICCKSVAFVDIIRIKEVWPHDGSYFSAGLLGVSLFQVPAKLFPNTFSGVRLDAPGQRCHLQGLCSSCDLFHDVHLWGFWSCCILLPVVQSLMVQWYIRKYLQKNGHRHFALCFCVCVFLFLMKILMHHHRTIIIA